MWYVVIAILSLCAGFFLGARFGSFAAKKDAVRQIDETLAEQKYWTPQAIKNFNPQGPKPPAGK